ncbi:hypothetical protein [Burkholderia stabilis]|uniref:hypothetical protein n=1 Tax=Burkholderia stabilis TaxID=95485 RepID=UPI001F4A7DDC|nr:hypothetical protein [Burkholderia stabilis]
MPQPTIMVWGSVDENGNKVNGSDNFSVESNGNGRYKIYFNCGYSTVPAVVATQNGYGQDDQSNLDGAVVPFVNQSYCQINTGNSVATHLVNRSFAFIAIGT